MTDQQRLLKQSIIALIFLLLVGSLSFGIYRGYNPPAPSPTPNPTAQLTPLKIISSQLLLVANSGYDFVARINNPNTDYGSADVEYELTVANAAGSSLGSQTGSFYILPGQTKYLVITPVKLSTLTSEVASQANLTIKSVDWQKLAPLATSGINLIPRDYTFQPVKQLGVVGKVNGAVLNSSDYDLGQVEVSVILFDSERNIMAVNRTEIRTFLAKTTRGFEVAWFTPLSGVVGSVEVEANTNVFENSNYLHQYQQPERFQQFY